MRFVFIMMMLLIMMTVPMMRMIVGIMLVSRML